jgi:hypothetical protein
MKPDPGNAEPQLGAKTSHAKLGQLCFAGCDLFTNEAICSFNLLQASPEFLYYILGCGRNHGHPLKRGTD